MNRIPAPALLSAAPRPGVGGGCDILNGGR